MIAVVVPAVFACVLLRTSAATAGDCATADLPRLQATVSLTSGLALGDAGLSRSCVVCLATAGLFRASDVSLDWVQSAPVVGCFAASYHQCSSGESGGAAMQSLAAGAACDAACRAAAVAALTDACAVCVMVATAAEGRTSPQALQMCAGPEPFTYPRVGKVWGCTNAGSTNYNANATHDDGSCSSGPLHDYTSPASGRLTGLSNLTGATCTSPDRSVACVADTCWAGCTFTAEACASRCAARRPECVGFNFRATDGVCELLSAPVGAACTAGNSSCLCVSSACTLDPATTALVGVWTYFSVAPRGCMLPSAVNFDADARRDNGACVVLGCNVSGSINFMPTANWNDGSCVPAINGCTNSARFNYNTHANNDSGCVLKVFGCTDSASLAFNPNANTPAPSNQATGQCTYRLALSFQPPTGAASPNPTVVETFTGQTAEECSRKCYALDACAAISTAGTGATDTTRGTCKLWTRLPATAASGLRLFERVALGCTDARFLEAAAHNPPANRDDGSCASLAVRGCQDPRYVEYSATHNLDDALTPAALKCNTLRPCGSGVLDCNGRCLTDSSPECIGTGMMSAHLTCSSWIGNGVCNTGQNAGPNLNCSAHNWDGGDCQSPCSRVHCVTGQCATTCNCATASGGCGNCGGQCVAIGVCTASCQCDMQHAGPHCELGPAPAGSIRLRLTLSTTLSASLIASINRNLNSNPRQPTTWTQQFEEELSRLLAIPFSRVSVVALMSGSTQVYFDLLPTSVNGELPPANLASILSYHVNSVVGSAFPQAFIQGSLLAKTDRTKGLRQVRVNSGTRLVTTSLVASVNPPSPPAPFSWPAPEPEPEPLLPPRVAYAPFMIRLPMTQEALSNTGKFRWVLASDNQYECLVLSNGTTRDVTTDSTTRTVVSPDPVDPLDTDGDSRQPYRRGHETFQVAIAPYCRERPTVSARFQSWNNNVPQISVEMVLQLMGPSAPNVLSITARPTEELCPEGRSGLDGKRPCFRPAADQLLEPEPRKAWIHWAWLVLLILLMFAEIGFGIKVYRYQFKKRQNNHHFASMEKARQLRDVAVKQEAQNTSNTSVYFGRRDKPPADHLVRRSYSTSRRQSAVSAGAGSMMKVFESEGDESHGYIENPLPPRIQRAPPPQPPPRPNSSPGGPSAAGSPAPSRATPRQGTAGAPASPESGRAWSSVAPFRAAVDAVRVGGGPFGTCALLLLACIIC